LIPIAAGGEGNGLVLTAIDAERCLGKSITAERSDFQAICGQQHAEALRASIHDSRRVFARSMEGYIMTIAIEKSRYYELIEQFRSARSATRPHIDRRWPPPTSLPSAMSARSPLTNEIIWKRSPWSSKITRAPTMPSIFRSAAHRRAQTFMDAHNMTISALGKLIGSKGVASEILSGKRGLSKSHMTILAKHFGVEPGSF